MKIIHVFPHDILQPQYYYLGNTKDIRGRTDFFIKRSIAYEEIALKGPRLGFDQQLLNIFKKKDLTPYDAVVLEYPIFPKTIRYLQKKHPQVKRIVRAHNAEFFHYLHYTWTCLVHLKQVKLAFTHFSSSVKRLHYDYATAKRCDALLSIVRWEKENYWRYFQIGGDLVNVPYFLPEKYTNQIRGDGKENYCVCLMSASKGTLPLLLDSVKNFSKLVKKLGQDCPEWRFLITGHSFENKYSLPGRIEPVGLLDNPLPVLQKARALIMLSDFGFGFKTKILEAILSGCYLMVTRKLYERLPEEIHPYCIIVNIYSLDSFKEALEKCKQTFPEGNINDTLKKQAFSALDEVFGFKNAEI